MVCASMPLPPAHVPFHAEAQSPVINRATDAGPGGGFFRHDHGSGVFGMGNGIEFAQKMYCLQVFAATKNIGKPLTGLA